MKAPFCILILCLSFWSCRQNEKHNDVRIRVVDQTDDQPVGYSQVLIYEQVGGSLVGNGGIDNLHEYITDENGELSISNWPTANRICAGKEPEYVDNCSQSDGGLVPVEGVVQIGIQPKAWLKLSVHKQLHDAVMSISWYDGIAVSAQYSWQNLSLSDSLIIPVFGNQSNTLHYRIIDNSNEVFEFEEDLFFSKHDTVAYMIENL